MALLHKRQKRRDSLKYHVIIFGCQMNIADAERLSAILESSGYKKTDNPDKADLVAAVMCSVRQSAVDRVYGLANKYRKLKKRPKLLLTGCILKKDKKRFKEIFDYVLPISELTSPKRGNKLFNYKKLLPSEESLPSDNRAYLPISNGCNNFCTYCVVPYTRGRLVCRDHKKILVEAKKIIKSGAKEIWLLGQNVNDYSSSTDKTIDFPKLLEMVDELPGSFKIFFMSPNPKNFSDKLINVTAKSKKYSRYLNLPVQSGDNEILKRMNRPYTREKYIELVEKLRKAMPDLNLSTDVIVGFPEETKKQFDNTAKLFRKIKFNIAYINKYSPRFGTAAAKIKDNVPWSEKKRREKILMDIINEK